MFAPENLQIAESVSIWIELIQFQLYLEFDLYPIHTNAFKTCLNII